MGALLVGLSKGGTGKTSTAVNLAYSLAQRGRRVLLVDTDEQGAAARSLGVTFRAGLAELVDGAPPSECVVEARPGLGLIGGGPALAAVKRDIARRDIGAERVLSEALGRLAMSPIGDISPAVDTAGALIILDTAPAVDGMMINALWAADMLLSPVQLEAPAVVQLAAFLDKAGQVASYRGRGYRRVDILPVMMDRRIRQAGDILAQLGAHYPGQVLEAIPTNAAISQAAAHGLAVSEYDRRAPGAVAYAALAAFYDEVTS